MDKSKFFRFYQHYPYSKWVKDKRLECHLEELLKQHPELNQESALLQYFCEEVKENFDALALQQNSAYVLPLQHLFAYLEPACLFTARKVGSDFNTKEYTFSDYFQLARKQLGEPKIIQDRLGKEREVPYVVWLCLKYDFNQADITTYAYFKLRSAILSRVFQHQESQGLSDWALLKKSSKKALRTELEQSGFSDEKIQHCLGAWQGFCAVYAEVKVPRNRRLPAPTETQWMAIFQYFSERNLIGDISEVESLLETCVRVLRERDKITNISLDGLDDGVRETQELEIVEKRDFQQLEWQEKPEFVTYYQQLIDFLGRAIATLPKSQGKKSQGKKSQGKKSQGKKSQGKKSQDKKSQGKKSQGKKPIDPRKLLILYYGFPGLSMTEIGDLFGVNQSTISRKLEKHKVSLLESLAQWYSISHAGEVHPPNSQFPNSPHPTPDTPHPTLGLPLTVENNDNLSKLLEIALSFYCRNRVLYCFLRRSLKSHPEFKIDLHFLSKYFGNLPAKLWHKPSGLETDLTPSKLSEKLSKLNQAIAGEFKCTEIQAKLELEQLEKIKAKLQQQLQNWVKQTLGLTNSNLEAIAQPSGLLIDSFLYQADYAILEQERR